MRLFSRGGLNEVRAFVRFYSPRPVRTYLAFLREQMLIPKGVCNRFHKQAQKHSDYYDDTLCRRWVDGSY